jgi:hypothetical protein
MKVPRIALLFCQSDANATLSYQHGWPRAFAGSEKFDCRLFNLSKLLFVDQLGVVRSLIGGKFDAIVLLHSVFSNQKELRGLLYQTVALAKLPKAYFIGNEYKLMPEKIAFCRNLGVSLLVTQSNDPSVLEMYRKALGCALACVPNTGFDTSIFSPVRPLRARVVDIGYRSYEGPWYLGNIEKTEIADYFLANALRLGLSVDISMDAAKRFDAKAYAIFLNSCRGQIGTESGGDYFELTDVTRNRVNAYMTANPGAAWLDVKHEFFDNYGPSIPMRIISGRQIEAAACKTVQILFEGRYNDYFRADEHFIPLKKDFSNIEDVVRKFHDDAYCERLVEKAYDVVMGELTYDRLIEKFSSELRHVL